MDPAVYPDALRGLYVLLADAGEAAGHLIRPELIVPVNYSDHNLPVVVHLQQINTSEGQVDRVEEIRITVYGFTPLQSKDICEAVLSYITGDGVSTPATPESAEYYFDHVRQRLGPSALDWPTDQVFPVSAQVDVRARPMSFV